MSARSSRCRRRRKELSFQVVGIAPGSGRVSFGKLFVPPGSTRGSPEIQFNVLQVDPAHLNPTLLKLSENPLVFALDITFIDGLLKRLIDQFAAIPTVVGLLSLLAAAVAMANTVSLQTLERRRQIGVLKAVGLKGRRVLLIMLLENTMVGLLGGLIGHGRERARRLDHDGGRHGRADPDSGAGDAGRRRAGDRLGADRVGGDVPERARRHPRAGSERPALRMRNIMRQTGFLPENASAASRRRAEFAEKLVESCPPALADEIALVGSTARGLADDESDLELNLWAETIPPLEERLAWLRAAGARDVQAEETARPDESYWVSFKLADIPAEVGWQTFTRLNKALDLIISGKVTDRQTLVFADVITSAIPLRTSGQLQRWQATLNPYSDALQRSLIGSAVESWSWSGYLASRRRMARRGEPLLLTQFLLNDLEMVMRLLYAIHRRWEVSEKWTLTVAREFAPPELIAQVDVVLSDPSLERRVELCAKLCLDVLALVPEGYDVSAAAESLWTGSE